MAEGTAKTINGHYRIAKNIYARCRLEVLKSDEHGVALFLGLKRPADTTAPVGTRIFLDESPVANEDLAGAFGQGMTTLSVMVKEVSEQDDKPLLLCTPLSREVFTERRTEQRRKVNFRVQLADMDFMAVEATLQGLTLQALAARKVLTKLTVENSYPVALKHKDLEYTLSGVIRNIQYDWDTYRHRLGLYLPSLTSELETVLNLLIDPSYKVAITNKQSIDTSKGKISLD